MNASLPTLIPRGTYPRSGPPGVVHLGLGAFHRAHQALVFDALLRAGDTRWGVFAVGMRQPTLADALQASGGWYPVVFEGDQTQWQWVGSIWQTGVAQTERERVIHAIASSSTRWLTLTVTEKAYTPALADLIIQGLVLRWDRGLPGITIASCDNLRHNGDQLHALCSAGASPISPSFASWITSACRFPNSMVDRIVPAATFALQEKTSAALGEPTDTAISAESFWEWVLEDSLLDPTDADCLRRVGVQVVPDITPFEDGKLRLLNGAHTAIACMGVLAAWSTVSAFMAHPTARQWLQALMMQDLSVGVTRPHWPTYVADLLARFANPHLAHQTAQIATDSSQKILNRWVPGITQARAMGRLPHQLALAAAAWMHHLAEQRENGQRYTLSDPLAQTLRDLVQGANGDPQATAQALGTLEAVWGDALPKDTMWLNAVTDAYVAIATHGALGAMEQYLKK